MTTAPDPTQHQSRPGRAIPPPELATLTADDLVTGEAVALDLPAAGLGLRIASGAVDVVVSLVLLVVVVLVASIASLQADGALQQLAVVATILVVFLVVPTTLETLTRGRSIGKLAFGLRTVRDDAGAISAQHAFVRALVGIVEIYAFTGVPAFFAALANNHGKRLGDFAAGTYVVRERFRLALPPPVAMPPGLERWARAADMRSLPTGLALAVRQYLARLPTLDPRAREEVGRRLADRVLAHVAPPPPSGTEPAAFLSAVVASRRERDQARLDRDRRLRERLTGA